MPVDKREKRNAHETSDLGAAVACLVGGPRRGQPACAEDTIFVPLLTYRTGPFSNSGIPIANGMHDYLTC